MDDYKQLRMIENIKNFKEMETAYKVNLKLCKYQEQQINKLATCIEQIKKISNFDCTCGHTQMCICNVCDKIDEILQKISECEVKNEV